MNNYLISVIIPIYNAEKYIRRCIDSVLNQTYENVEVLLINDRSTDNSGFICDEYQKKDDRISVLHKENGGVSSARNLGVQNMQGFYSIHVDSDDWIEPTMLSDMYAVAVGGNLDIVICDYYKDYIDRSDIIECNPHCTSGEELFDKLLSYEINGSCWNELIHNNLYKKIILIFLNLLTLVKRPNHTI